MSFRRRPALCALVPLIAAAGALLFLPWRNRLLLVEARTGRILVDRPVPETFALSYVHSANRGRVLEDYSVGPSGVIRLERALFEGYGAGVPAVGDGEETLEVTREGTLARYNSRPIPRLVFFVGTVAGHELVFRDETLKLTDLVPPRTSVLVTVSRVSNATLFRRKFNG